MNRLLRALFCRIDGRRYRRSIEHALALNLRGEVRNDGLTLAKAATSLEIEWYARDIHPWDRNRNLSAVEKEHLFLDQCLADTEAAILRLLQLLPQVDSLNVRVLEPTSKATIIAGSIYRSTLETNDRLSVGMRLRLSGVTFRLSGWQFEPLHLPDNQDYAGAVNRTSGFVSSQA